MAFIQRYSPFTRLKFYFIKNKLNEKPLASEVLTAQLNSSPYWTSYFVPYRSILNDQFAYSHFNWTNRHGVNYHILRIGCYPYIKYHCSRRSFQDLSIEDLVYTILKCINLGIPTLSYGIAAIFLIRYHKDVKLEKGKIVRIYFLNQENVNSPH